MQNKRIVCLGGGIGTVNLIRGLKDYSDALSVVVSMADEGGSSGRLRRLYNVYPPGDIVSCMAAMASNNPQLEKLFLYRFPGDRYANDELLAGHKLGNLILVALSDLTKDFSQAVKTFQNLFDIQGTFLPATSQPISISAKTIEGKIIKGEENIDLGKYNGARVLDTVYIHPSDPSVASDVLQALQKADVIVAGPGDLYTTILPVLIIPKIASILQKSSAKKIFVVNIANKPFETKNYDVNDFIYSIKKHLGFFPFTHVVVNNNFSIKIPRKFHYQYVPFKEKVQKNRVKSLADILTHIKIIQCDLVNPSFPLYHNPQKLAKAIVQAYN